jgi:glycosyltransferase involved in cell wall biosynthesis
MVLRIIWAFLLACGFLYWLMQFFASIRTIRSVCVLEEIPEHELPQWPKVSVIMPARNEEKTMRKALELRLNDDYPNIEYIIVDDRSTDKTGEIIDAFAGKDTRVRPLHIKDLPEGWLGKLYAMDQGAKKAKGDWLLFSDIDVHIARGTMKRAVAHAENQDIDHLAIFPEIYSVSFFIDILTTIFVRMISSGVKLWEIEDPDSKAAVGVGSFNLVRRSAFERSGAFDAIKLEHGDDIALGQLLKESGSRQMLLNGRDHVGVVFYRSVREAVVAVERPTYTALGKFSFVRLFLAGCVLLWLELSPLFALLPVGLPFHYLIAAIMIPLSFTPGVLMNHWFRRSLWPVFVMPLGSLIMVFMIWRSGLLGALRGGVYWRGTFYPTEMLK